jgi:hypothetical protein
MDYGISLFSWADGFPVPGLMRRNNDDAAEEGREAISPAMQSANRNFGAADDKPASDAVRSRDDQTNRAVQHATDRS